MTSEEYDCNGECVGEEQTGPSLQCITKNGGREKDSKVCVLHGGSGARGGGRSENTAMSRRPLGLSLCPIKAPCEKRKGKAVTGDRSITSTSASVLEGAGAPSMQCGRG